MAIPIGAIIKGVATVSTIMNTVESISNMKQTRKAMNGLGTATEVNKGVQAFNSLMKNNDKIELGLGFLGLENLSPENILTSVAKNNETNGVMASLQQLRHEVQRTMYRESGNAFNPGTNYYFENYNDYIMRQNYLNSDLTNMRQAQQMYQTELRNLQQTSNKNYIYNQMRSQTNYSDTYRNRPIY